jgi:sulfotransferase
LDNVLDSVFDNYYKDWPQQYIIDRGPVMTPGNLMLMQKHYRRPFKCIVILRDLMDVLASYMKWYKNNPDAFPNRFNLNSDDEKLGMIMNKDGAVAKDLEAIKNAFNYPDICHFVKYDDLISRPEQEMRKIYQFIGLPYYNHQFENLQQINVNGIGYDDKVVGKNMHTIRNVVRKEINPYLDQIPERIRQKYGHIRF